MLDSVSSWEDFKEVGFYGHCTMLMVLLLVVMVFVLVILEEMVMMIMVVVGPMVERGANMRKWVILLLGSLETGKCN